MSKRAHQMHAGSVLHKHESQSTTLGRRAEDRSQAEKNLSALSGLLAGYGGDADQDTAIKVSDLVWKSFLSDEDDEDPVVKHWLEICSIVRGGGTRTERIRSVIDYCHDNDISAQTYPVL